jgi:Zinc-binding dehydrogenase/Alcohol dehydrogenase GroES-like domain
MDIYQRQGLPPYGGNLPVVPGAEGAGTVAAVGPDVSGIAVGDRVAWTGVPGSYAERALIPADRGGRPRRDRHPGRRSGDAPGRDCQYLCIDTFPVAEGDVVVVVVHAAAGGVGLLLTQLVKRRGGIVVATTSTNEKADLAQQAGADHLAGYEDFAAVAKQASGGVASVVFDGVGKTTFDQSPAALRPRGYMVLYGVASGPVPRSTCSGWPGGRLPVHHPPDHGPLRRQARGAGAPRGRPVLVDRQGPAPAAHRRGLPARGRGPGRRGLERPADHRQTAPAPRLSRQPISKV